MKNEWRQIPTFPDYLINKKGDIFSIRKLCKLNGYVNKIGYIWTNKTWRHI